MHFQPGRQAQVRSLSPDVPSGDTSRQVAGTNEHQ
jgi:hypothetical protein